MTKVDQRGFDNQPDVLLDTRAAARFLGVQARTLYAYASRGLIARVRDGRRSRYPRAELERWKARHDARAGHGPVAAAALHWGEPVLSTAVATVTPRGPLYRGHLAADLARAGVPFLDVCGLLWTGRLAPPPPGPERHRHRVRGATGTDPVLRLMDVAVAGLQHTSAPGGLPLAVELGRARTLLMAFAAATAGGRARSADADVATKLLGGYGVPVTSTRRRLVDAALVLCADHELNASTFAARVAASTGADLQACVLAALAAFQGPRHGGASRALEALLAEVKRPGDAGRVVRERTARGETLPGFGHPLYPDGDPRASVLLSLCGKRGRTAPLARLAALIDAAAKHRGERPNIDAALVAVARTLALPVGAPTALFAVGRTAGWIAHVLEQRESSALLRPRARYVGPDAPA